MPVWVTPPSFAAGDTAGVGAKLQQLSDDLAVLGGAWTSYTPSLTAATTNPTGYTTTGSGYIAVGKLIIFRAFITMGASTGAGAYSITLPVTPANLATGSQSARAIYVDTGTGYKMGAAMIGATATVALLADPTVAGDYLRVVTPTVPFTFAAGDLITVHGTYEAA